MKPPRFRTLRSHASHLASATQEKQSMKRAPLFVLAGTIAGFAGILSFHTRPATPAALAGPASQAGGGTHRGSQATAPPTNHSVPPAAPVRTPVAPPDPYAHAPP